MQSYQLKEKQNYYRREKGGHFDLFITMIKGVHLAVKIEKQTGTIRKKLCNHIKQ